MEDVIINGIKYVPEHIVLKEGLTLEKLKLALFSLFWGSPKKDSFIDNFNEYGADLYVFVTDSPRSYDDEHRLENKAEEVMLALKELENDKSED